MDGYIHHRLRATDHAGQVKCYTYWFRRNGEIRDNEVRILVVDEGQPTETAHIYDTRHLLKPQSVAYAAVEAELPAFLAANPAIHRAVINSVDEEKELAHISTYSYDSSNDTVVEGRAIAFRRAGAIHIKVLKNEIV